MAVKESVRAKDNGDRLIRGRKNIFASIVILCHNDGSYLFECLRSLFRNTRLTYELILVDNATRDGSLPFFRAMAGLNRDDQKWRRIRQALNLSPHMRKPGGLLNINIIRNARNHFFSGGNNQGIGAARGENIVLLNADTWIGPGWLEGFKECLTRHPSAGVIGPCTNSAVGWQHVHGVPEMTMRSFFNFAEKWRKNYSGTYYPVHRLTAFCWLIPKRTVAKVGVLDPRFGPGGYEDYDYCMRVQEAGLDILLAEEVFVYHHGGKGYVNMDYARLRRRNRRILINKYRDQALVNNLDLETF